MVMSPDILSHVARNFIMLKKILKMLVRVKCETQVVCFAVVFMEIVNLK